MLVADGFDEAIIGVVQCKGRPDLVCYDYEKCIQVLVKTGMDEEEARAHMEFNVIDAYMGEDTPAFLRRGDRGYVDEWADGL